MSLQRCPSLAPCPLPADFAGTTETYLRTQIVPELKLKPVGKSALHLFMIVWRRKENPERVEFDHFFSMVGKKGARKKWRCGVGVEDVMSSHGLTTPSLVAGRPAPPPQCLLNPRSLLVPVPSVPIPLSSCCVRATRLTGLS